MSVLAGIWRLMDASHRRQFFVLLALGALMAASTLVGVAAVLPFFAVLADSAAIEHLPTLHTLYQAAGFKQVRDFQLALGGAFIAALLAANAINYFGNVAMIRFAYEVGSTFHNRLFAAYLHSSYAFHLEMDTAILSRNVIYEASRCSIGILQSALLLSVNVMTATLIIASVLLLNPLVGAAAFLSLGAAYAAIYAAVRRRLLANGIVDSASYEERIRVVQEGLGAIKEIITLHSQRPFVERFERSCETIARTAVNTLAISLAPRFVLEFFTAAGLAAIALTLCLTDVEGGRWLGRLSFLGLAAYRLLPALQQVFVAAVKIRADSPALAHIAADLERARSAMDGARPAAPDSIWRNRPMVGIALRGVTFSYGGERGAAVREVSLEVPARSLTAFIGANGSGKTTTADLLLGLLAPQAGTVEIDGIALDAANRGLWRCAVAYVPQQIFLLDASVAQNIAFGVDPEDIDERRLSRAARLAQVDDFVAQWPKGYSERLGERGVRLSGGQRQRIGIARALYRDASLLILDEASSALDGLSEEEFVSMLEMLRGTRTIIVIAHRMSTVRGCDRMFEFNAGRIAEARVAEGRVVHRRVPPGDPLHVFSNNKNTNGLLASSRPFGSPRR